MTRAEACWTVEGLRLVPLNYRLKNVSFNCEE